MLFRLIALSIAFLSSSLFSLSSDNTSLRNLFLLSIKTTPIKSERARLLDLIHKDKIGGIYLKNEQQFLEQLYLCNYLQKEAVSPLLVMQSLIPDEQHNQALIFPSPEVLYSIQSKDMIYRLGQELGRQALLTGIHATVLPEENSVNGFQEHDITALNCGLASNHVAALSLNNKHLPSFTSQESVKGVVYTDRHLIPQTRASKEEAIFIDLSHQKEFLTQEDLLQIFELDVDSVILSPSQSYLIEPFHDALQSNPILLKKLQAKELCVAQLKQSIISKSPYLLFEDFSENVLITPYTKKLYHDIYQNALTAIKQTSSYNLDNKKQTNVIQLGEPSLSSLAQSLETTSHKAAFHLSEGVSNKNLLLSLEKNIDKKTPLLILAFDYEKTDINQKLLTELLQNLTEKQVTISVIVMTPSSWSDNFLKADNILLHYNDSPLAQEGIFNIITGKGQPNGILPPNILLQEQRR